MVTFTAMAGIATAQVIALGRAMKGVSWTSFISSIAKSTVAVRAFGLALKAIPFVGIIAGAVQLTHAILNIEIGAGAAMKAQEKMNRAIDNFNEKGLSEIEALNRIFEKLKSAKEGTDGWRTAREDLQSKYGDYIKDLGIEINTVNDLAGAYVSLTQRSAGVSGLTPTSPVQMATIYGFEFSSVDPVTIQVDSTIGNMFYLYNESGSNMLTGVTGTPTSINNGQALSHLITDGVIRFHIVITV